MNKNIETIWATRKNFLHVMEGLSIEQLNEVPRGFNNNILWNFGHIIVAQQGLCYRLSGLPLKINAAYVLKYTRGTKPESFIDKTEFLYLKEQALKLIDILETDVQEGSFKTFDSYTTSAGYELHDIDDAINFTTMHEGLHLGYSMALKKVITT